MSNDNVPHDPDHRAAVGAQVQRGVRRAATWLRQRWRAHVFRGVDLQPRDADGMVRWACSKCGKLHLLEYGLQAPGKIEGPWGVRP